MALHVIVHHQRDTVQPWINAWLDDQRIEAIQTTKEIGGLCQGAKERGQRVFVHRCGSGELSPQIGCSAEVESVDKIDNTTALVWFKNPIPLNQVPPRSPNKGQNFYLA